MSRVLATAVSLWIFALGVAAQDASRPPPMVSVAAAYTKMIADEAVFLGRVEAVDKADIVALVEGPLEKKLVADGYGVDEGQLLFQIKSDLYEAELGAQQAALAKAEAELQLAQIELARKEQLVERGSSSTSELDIAKANEMVARANVGAAQSAVAKARITLSNTQVLAPFPGRVGRSNFSVGVVVKPGSGSLTTLVRERPIYVSFYLDDKQIVDVLERVGGRMAQITGEEMAPTITVELSNGSILEEKGKLVFIDNRVDPTTGSILLRAEFENAEGLLVDSTFVDVRIASQEPTLRTLVPQAAIQRDQRGEFVLVVNQQSMVEQRYIETGHEFETEMIVLGGLQEGEAIIVEGLQQVRPGVSVEAIFATDGRE